MFVFENLPLELSYHIDSYIEAEQMRNTIFTYKICLAQLSHNTKHIKYAMNNLDDVEIDGCRIYRRYSRCCRFFPDGEYVLKWRMCRKFPCYGFIGDEI